MKCNRFSFVNKLKVLLIWAFSVLFLCNCSMQIIPSQYDIKLSSKTSELFIDVGGGSCQLEVCLNNYRYQTLSSEQNFFLSYHILSPDGETIEFDGARSLIAPIAARGIENECMEVIAPIAAGEYIIEIDLVEEGVTWFSQQGMRTLKLPLVVSQTYTPAFDSTAIDSEITQLNLSQGDSISIPITIYNNGTMPLYPKGKMSVHASYHIRYEDGRELLYDGMRTNLPCTIMPGDHKEVILTVDNNIFQESGNYMLSVDLVIEGVAWFSQNGMDIINIPVTFKRIDQGTGITIK